MCRLRPPVSASNCIFTNTNGARIRIAHNMRKKIRCNTCSCWDGRLLCTKLACSDDDDQGGNGTNNDGDSDAECRRCFLSNPVRPVCGPDGITYKSKCQAIYCRNISQFDLRDGACTSSVSAVERKIAFLCLKTLLPRYIDSFVTYMYMDVHPPTHHDNSVSLIKSQCCSLEPSALQDECQVPCEEDQVCIPTRVRCLDADRCPKRKCGMLKAASMHACMRMHCCCIQVASLLWAYYAHTPGPNCS